jgi:hypothetical protein
MYEAGPLRSVREKDEKEGLMRNSFKMAPLIGAAGLLAAGQAQAVPAFAVQTRFVRWLWCESR